MAFHHPMFSLLVPRKTSRSRLPSTEGWRSSSIIPLGEGDWQLKFGEGALQNFLGSQFVCLNVYVAMPSRMFQTAILLSVFMWKPVEVLALSTHLVGCIQVDQHIWFCKALPHRRDIGVFLDDLTRVPSSDLKSMSQGSFTGRTWANDGDAEGGFRSAHDSNFPIQFKEAHELRDIVYRHPGEVKSLQQAR